MPLSEEEQKLLDQMEAALVAEDPRLAHTMRGVPRRTVHKRKATLSGLGFLAGMGLLITGMQVTPLMSIAGFLLMLVSTVVAVSSWRHLPPSGPPKRTGSTQAGPRGDTPFMDRMEERWRRRQDEGS